MEPTPGSTTLIWANVVDLAPGSSRSLSYRVSHDPALFAVGDAYSDHGYAYVNTDPHVAPDFTLTGEADPTTFTVLPWTPKTGWILCEMFFANGQPLPFDGRRILRNALDQARTAGFTYVTGLEVEWYLTRMVDNMLGGEELGGPGNPAPAPIVTPASHGFQYLLENHNDEIDDVLQALLGTMTDLGLPIRSLEDEWGPGQVEMTFDPMDGIRSADAMILFRAATKQVCRRLGFHASFMCKPKLASAYSSGWHLHQSLASAESGASLLREVRDALVALIQRARVEQPPLEWTRTTTAFAT